MQVKLSSEMDFIVLEVNAHLSLKIIDQGINNLWMTSKLFRINLIHSSVNLLSTKSLFLSGQLSFRYKNPFETFLDLYQHFGEILKVKYSKGTGFVFINYPGFLKKH